TDDSIDAVVNVVVCLVEQGSRAGAEHDACPTESTVAAVVAERIVQGIVRERREDAAPGEHATDQLRRGEVLPGIVVVLPEPWRAAFADLFVLALGAAAVAVDVVAVVAL